MRIKFENLGWVEVTLDIAEGFIKGQVINISARYDDEVKGITECEIDANQNSWKPIETAPRDGSKILTICGNLFSVRAWGVGEDDEEQWLPRIRGVFPTHWMPLPNRPKLAK